MEGVSFALRNNIETIESLGIHINEVRAVGGGLKSPVWLDTLGKILKKPVTTVSVQDTANLGNILLCGKALGIFTSYKDALESIVTTDIHLNYPDGAAVYEKQYSIFLELYQQLQSTFRHSAQS
jgi:xylulokinase